MTRGGTTHEALRARERMPFQIAMLAAVVLVIAAVIIVVALLAT